MSFATTSPQNCKKRPRNLFNVKSGEVKVSCNVQCKRIKLSDFDFYDEQDHYLYLDPADEEVQIQVSIRNDVITSPSVYYMLEDDPADEELESPQSPENQNTSN